VRSGARSVTTAPPARRSPPGSADGLREPDGAEDVPLPRCGEAPARRRRTASEIGGPLYSAPSPCTRSRRLRRSWRAGWPRPLPHRRAAGPVLRGTPYGRCPIGSGYPGRHVRLGGVSHRAPLRRTTSHRGDPRCFTWNTARRTGSLFHVKHLEQRPPDALPREWPNGLRAPRRHVEVDVVNPAPHPPSDDVSRETPDAHQPPGAAGRTGSRRAEWSLTLRRAHAATQSTNGGRAREVTHAEAVLRRTGTQDAIPRWGRRRFT
jgi:hypothetical protein